MTRVAEVVAPRDAPLVAELAPGQAVKIVGLGGVGTTFSRFGCLLLASLGRPVRVVLIDGDTFDPTANASRMFFSTAGPKAGVVRGDLLPFFVGTPLSLSAVDEFVTPDNVARLLHDGDIVVLCVDNHRTRWLVNRHCATLANVCLLSGGNDGVGVDSSGTHRRGTYGNVQVFVRRGGRDLSPSLACYHPEIATPRDVLPSEASCIDLLASTPQILPANVQTAAALLSTLWLYLCGRLHYPELAFDIAEGTMGPLPLGPGPHPTPATTAARG